MWVVVRCAAILALVISTACAKKRKPKLSKQQMEAMMRDVVTSGSKDSSPPPIAAMVESTEQPPQAGGGRESGTLDPNVWNEFEPDASEPRCSDVLPTVHANIADWSSLNQSYATIVTDVPDTFNWDKTIFSDRKRFLKTFRDRVVSAGYGSVWTLGSMQPIVTVNDNMLGRLGDRKEFEGDKEKWQIFDFEFFEQMTKPKPNTVLPVLRKWQMPRESRFLSLGGQGSCTQFHVHGPSFITLLSGHKHWYMHPAGVLPDATAAALHTKTTLWKETVLPALEPAQKPIACVQGPGETLFVPDGWPHATENADDVIAMGWHQSGRVETRDCEINPGGYLCLIQLFEEAQGAADRAINSKAKKEVARTLRSLFARAMKISKEFAMHQTAHFHLHTLIELDPKAGRKLFDRLKKYVIQMLDGVKFNSYEARIYAGLAGKLSSVLTKPAVTPNGREKMNPRMDSRKSKESAVEILHAATSKVPGNMLSIEVAKLYMEMGKFKEAIDHMEQFREYSPAEADHPQFQSMYDRAKANYARM